MIITCERKSYHEIVVCVSLEANDPKGMEEVVKAALLAFCDDADHIVCRLHRWSGRPIITARTNIVFAHGDILITTKQRVVLAITDFSNRRNLDLKVRS